MPRAEKMFSDCPKIRIDTRANGSVSGSEVPDALGFLGLLGLVAVCAIEGETTKGDVMN